MFLNGLSVISILRIEISFVLDVLLKRIYIGLQLQLVVLYRRLLTMLLMRFNSSLCPAVLWSNTEEKLLLDSLKILWLYELWLLYYSGFLKLLSSEIWERYSGLVSFLRKGRLEMKGLTYSVDAHQAKQLQLFSAVELIRFVVTRLHG